MGDGTFKVLECPELGRYGVAGRNLKAGDRLFEELPFAVGPKLDSPPLCLECCCPVDGGEGGPRCSRCGWPLCEDCSGPGSELVYHRGECEVFAASGVRFRPVEDSTAGCVQLDCITPLRVLLAKEADEARWTREIEPMEYHDAERRESANWKVDENNIVSFLCGPCKLGDRFSRELVQRAIGLLD
uniref:SET domain-containing protein n=1 Tax=Anopheles maculatus TaxID=74869 RepID=A0A182SPZ4_9DIPT